MISKISISMPRELEEYTKRRVLDGGYGSISEYIRELVRIDRRFTDGPARPDIDGTDATDSWNKNNHEPATRRTRTANRRPNMLSVQGFGDKDDTC